MELLKSRIDHYLYSKIAEISKSDRETELLKDVFHGGKRLRPMICLAIGDSFSQKEPIENIAIAIEMIHNASLIIDDLPCMDNDNYRRDQETIHYKYGESVAIQEALKIMGVALNLIFKTVGQLSNSSEKIFIFNEIIYKNLGRDGLPMGQLIDINLLKNRFNIANRKQHKDLIFKKTTTLFNLSFLLSFAIYIDDKTKIATMERASKYFGLAFQIYDDFTDVEQDRAKNSPNIVNKLGRGEAYKMFHVAVEKSKGSLAELNIKLDFFNEIFSKLSQKVHL